MSLSEKEIEGFRANLEQVQYALEADPENAELLKLQRDLTQLLSLAHDGTPAEPQEVKSFNVGDVVESASTENDGHWYQCRIDKIIQTPDGVQYAISYLEDSNVTNVVDASQVRSVVENTDQAEGDPQFKTNKQRALESREYKKARREKKQERLRKLEEESEKDKKSWQSFANGKVKKKGKKSKVPNIMNKKSMFATTESGKVGVIGSGNKLTEFTQRGKHVHEKADD